MDSMNAINILVIMAISLPLALCALWLSGFCLLFLISYSVGHDEPTLYSMLLATMLMHSFIVEVVLAYFMGLYFISPTLAPQIMVLIGMLALLTIPVFLRKFSLKMKS